jgi:hypothetical protein
MTIFGSPTIRPQWSLGFVGIHLNTVSYGLIALVCLAHGLYLFHGCPLELAPDEAHYWDWSRNLDSCYYSKGPLVAWLIRGSCELFGSVATEWTGTAMPAVRIPAIVCFALLMVGIHELFRRILGASWALVGVAFGLTLPPVQALGTLMTIDPPFLAAWAWGCVGLHAALMDRRRWGWPLVSVAILLGFWAKATIILLPVGSALFLICSPEHRRKHGKAAFAWLALGCFAGLFPILEWNARHDWVGFRHTAGHAVGNSAEEGLRWWGPLEFLLVQWCLLMGLSACLLIWGLRRYHPFHAATNDALRLCWCLTIVPFAVFGVASALSRGQPNWPAPAYLSGALLAVRVYHDKIAGSTSRSARVWRAAMLISALMGTLMSLAIHHPSLYRPLLASWLPSATVERPIPLRRLDPTCRLAGWRQLAAAIDRMSDERERLDGVRPVIAVMNWNVAGEIGFYAAGNPTVYSFGALAGERHTQYDLWRPNPIADAQVFEGRTFLYVGERFPEWTGRFDRVDGPVEVFASDGPNPVASWKVWTGRNYHGQGNGGRSSSRGY